MTDVFDLAGRKVAGSDGVTVRLRQGVGIQYNGEHLEGGPHILPAHLAHNLVMTNRADIIPAETPAAVDGAPDDVVQRDPVVESREVRRRR